MPAFPPVWRARSDASAPSPIRCACRSLPCAGRCASAPMRRSSAVRTACAPSAPSLARFTSGVGCHARRTCATRRAPPAAATSRNAANPFPLGRACAVRGGTLAAVSLAHAAWLRQCQSAHRRSCAAEGATTRFLSSPSKRELHRPWRWRMTGASSSPAPRACGVSFPADDEGSTVLTGLVLLRGLDTRRRRDSVVDSAADEE